MPSQTRPLPRAEAISLRAGWRAGPPMGSTAVAIHQAASYPFCDIEHAENLFAPKVLGNIDARVTGPTVVSTLGARHDV